MLDSTYARHIAADCNAAEGVVPCDIPAGCFRLQIGRQALDQTSNQLTEAAFKFG